MFVNQLNTDDIKKYWQGCHVKFKEDGDRIYHIRAVDGKYIYAEDRQGEEVLIDLAKGYNIDYVIPKKTTYQYGDYAACLSRIPARMWKKGMNKANTQFETLTSTGWKVTTYDIAIIEGFVNKPSYYHIEEALNLFAKTENQQSCALSPRFSLHRKGNVYLDTTPVARLEQQAKRLVAKKIFVPELSKLFPGMTVKGI
jgi:hypothetical protein